MNTCEHSGPRKQARYSFPSQRINSASPGPCQCGQGHWAPSFGPMLVWAPIDVPVVDTTRVSSEYLDRAVQVPNSTPEREWALFGIAYDLAMRAALDGPLATVFAEDVQRRARWRREGNPPQGNYSTRGRRTVLLFPVRAAMVD